MTGGRAWYTGSRRRPDGGAVRAWPLLAVVCLGLGAAPSLSPVRARGGAAAATVITINSTADVVNGSTSTVAALLANPGADGVSLREAISAANNTPDAVTIRFSTAAVIALGSALPPLRGGNVSIEGPATIRGGPQTVPTAFTAGLHLASGGNRIVDFTIEGFFLTGILIAPVDGPLTAGATFAGNTLDRVSIRGVRDGVVLGDFFTNECGQSSACVTHNSYVRTAVVGSSIEVTRFGIRVDPAKVVGDVIDSLTITGNTLAIGTAAAPDADGAPIQIDVAGLADSTRISRVLVANNTIESVQAGGDGAIMIASGLQRARHSVIEDVRVTGNHIHVTRPSSNVPCCHGIMISAGSDYFVYDPQVYGGAPDDNVVRRIEISGNEVTGDLKLGAIRLQAGVDAGGSRNRVEAVQVRNNTVRSNVRGQGIRLWVGQIGRGLTVTDNAITDVDIEGNDIVTGDADPSVDLSNTGGIVLLGGHDGGRGGLISDVRLTSNRITTGYAGIQLIGGMVPQGTSAQVQGNSVRCVRMQGNAVVGATASLLVQANSGSASGNSLTFITTDTSRLEMPGAPAADPLLKELAATGC